MRATANETAGEKAGAEWLEVVRQKQPQDLSKRLPRNKLKVVMSLLIWLMYRNCVRYWVPYCVPYCIPYTGCFFFIIYFIDDMSKNRTQLQAVDMAHVNNNVLTLLRHKASKIFLFVVKVAVAVQTTNDPLSNNERISPRLPYQFLKESDSVPDKPLNDARYTIMYVGIYKFCEKILILLTR